MPQTVEIPDQGVAEFPDDFTPDQIKGVIQQKFYATPQPTAATPAEQGGIVQSVVSEAKALAGQALHAVNPINLVRGVLDIQPRSGLQEVMRTGRILRDIVGGAGIGETIRKEAPEIAQQQEAIMGMHGPEAQRETLSGIGTQLGMVAAPFLHGKTIPIREAVPENLRETAFGKAEPATPMEAATEPIVTPPNEPTGIAQPQIEPSGLYTEGQKLGAQFEDLQRQAADIQERINVQREAQPVPEAAAPVTAEPIPEPAPISVPTETTTAQPLPKNVDLTENPDLPPERPRLAVKLDDGTVLHANDVALHSQLLDKSGVDPKRVVDSGTYGQISGEFRSMTPESVEIFPKPTEEVIQNASEITSPEGVTQPEVRPRVGEEAPLRQQGETTEARQGIEEGAEAPEDVVEPPLRPEFVPSPEKSSYTTYGREAIPGLQIAGGEARGAQPIPEAVQPGEFAKKGYTAVEPAPETPVPAATAPLPQKPSKIGQSIEAKAVEAKLTKGFAETAGYDPITIPEQSQMATDLVRDNLPLSRSIVRGEAPLPPKLKGTSLLVAMEEHLVRNPDARTAYELANSPLTSATSAAAQELRLAGERIPDSITAKFQEIREARRAGPKLRGETTETVARDITKEVVKTASKRPTWEAFVREIVCT